MSDIETKISDLSAVVTPALTDIFPVVQTAEVGVKTRKESLQQVLTLFETYFAQLSNNLSDLASIRQARTNLVLSDTFSPQTAGAYVMVNPLGNENVTIVPKATAPGCSFQLPSMSVNDANSSDVGTLFYIYGDPTGANNFNLLNPDGTTLIASMAPGQLVVISLLSKNTSVNGTLTILYNSATVLPLSGGTMTGNLILNGDASANLQAVTYEQLKAVLKPTCDILTTTNLNATYNNGTSGVGATLTANTNVAFQYNGYLGAVGHTVAIGGQSSQLQNGLYMVTTEGVNGVTPYVLTRPSSYDGSANGIIKAGDIIPILFLDTANLLRPGLAMQTSQGTITVGTSAISFTAPVAVDGSSIVFNSSGQLAIGTVPNANLSGMTIDAQTGTTYTMTLSDFQSGYLTLNNSSAVTVTIPQTSATAIGAGLSCQVRNIGAGLVTFALQGSDVAIGNTTIAAGGVATVTKRIAGSPNTFDIAGGTSNPTFSFESRVSTAANQTYHFSTRAPFAGTLTNIAGLTRSGTCTVTAEINGVSVTGTALSASSTISNQAITAANNFAIGDSIQYVVSSNSSALDLEVTAAYTRAF